jgi:hypothetical protein
MAPRTVASRARWGSHSAQLALWALTPSQNWRNLPTRLPRGLPATIALLIAPIEMPAIQLGSISRSARAS